MRPILTIKDIAQEAQLIKSRVVICCVLIACMSVVILVRMFQLQVVGYEHFATLSEDNRVKIVPVAPTRGLVFDRNGTVIAQNVPTYSLEVVPEAVRDIDGLIADLRRMIPISEDDEARFRELLKKKRRFDSLPLRYRLNEQEVARFSVNRHMFPGVDVQARLSRDYPLSEIGSHLIGYVGRINEEELQTIDTSNYRATAHIGKTGVEQAYEDLLHGTVGYQHVETNAQGRTLRVLQRKDPVPGSSLYLTIDVGLQAVAEQALGEENGAVVAIEPASGDVLALVSVPTYDPNLFVDGIDKATYDTLIGSPDRPLFNRAINGQYPPGSTVKPFYGLAGLEHKLDQAHETTFCPGYFQLPGKERRYRDWKKGGHGRVDLNRAIVESCDVYFYVLSQNLGIERMHNFMTRFGFGSPTGIDLKGESDGLMPSPKWKRRNRNQPWYPGETLITGIGQGFMLTTPLQLASATATLAMRGLRLKPEVLLRRVDPATLEPVEHVPNPPEVIEPGSAKNWDDIVEAMRQVVHGPRGTARRISIGATYQMAGKTGTAQVFSVGQNEEYEEEEVEKRLRDHGLFIAFAPVDKPKIAVAVVAENGGSGSRSAAPIARKVIDYYLDSLKERAPDDGPMLTAARSHPLTQRQAR
ncbi:MAG TPA: penicillin-binding protein 2 [Gammaproteobacteria bacterium]|nr:penicillin-binding protein 2 [Gammaproteobacteria bacterium]